MSINIDSLSAKELDALINQAKKRKTTLSRRKPVAVVRKKLTQLARAEGYTIAELFGGVSGDADGGNLAVEVQPFMLVSEFQHWSSSPEV